MLCQGMAEAEAYLRDLAKGRGAEISTRPCGGNYSFLHRETFYYGHVETIANFDPRALYPRVRGRGGGPYVFRLLQMRIAGS